MTAVPGLEARLAQFSEAVDGQMRRALDQAGLPHDLAGMLQYHLGWVDDQFHPVSAARGKQIRPTLCLLACEAAGGDWQQAIPSATAIELVHNFSLIHDDIEDQSPLRRHRPTLWALWGVPLAVNAGDLLLVLAQLAVLGEGESGLGAPEAVRLLNWACVALCAGQHRDLIVDAEAEPSLAAYLAMIEGKTAALVSAAAELGALAAGAEAPARVSYARFGQELGMAFQLQDDVLDLWGSEARTGKPAREDLRSGKYSLPFVLACDLAEPKARAELRQMYGQPTPLPEPAIDVLVSAIEALRVRAAADELIQDRYVAALAALADAAPIGEAAGPLRDLAARLMGREA